MFVDLLEFYHNLMGNSKYMFDLSFQILNYFVLKV